MRSSRLRSYIAAPIIAAIVVFLGPLAWLLATGRLSLFRHEHTAEVQRFVSGAVALLGFTLFLLGLAFFRYLGWIQARLQAQEVALEESAKTLRAWNESLETRVAERTRELAESEARYRAIFEAEPACVKVIDSTCRLIAMNPAGLRMIGAQDFEQVRGIDVTTYVAPEYHAAFRETVERVYHGETVSLLFESVGRTGKRRWLEQHASPIFAGEEPQRVSTLLAVVQDVTRRRRAELALRESEARLVMALHAARMGVWELDFSTGNVYWSDELLTLLGLPDGANRRSLREATLVVHPADRLALAEALQRALYDERGGGFVNSQHRVLLPGGEVRWVQANGRLRKDMERKVISGVIADITERKQGEEALRRALQEKQVLLREVFHRVKNNLQIVSSLLRLQARAQSNPVLAHCLQESRARVEAMSLIQEELYREEHIGEVNLGGYIARLVIAMHEFYGNDGIPISYRPESARIVNIETALPVGLILNELVSNAVKHAFEGLEETNGRHIALRMTELPGGGFTLEVSDNGRGLPTGMDPTSAKSIGLGIVQSLCAQLGATLSWQSGSAGTTWTLQFAEVNYPARIEEEMPCA